MSYIRDDKLLHRFVLNPKDKNAEDGTLTWSIYFEIGVCRLKFVSLCNSSQNFIVQT